CDALASGTDNYFGHLYRRNNIIVPRESTGTGGTIPDDDIAVCYVNWYGSLAYCQWLGGSLPTEGQWELALRRRSNGADIVTTGTGLGDQSSYLNSYAYAYDGYTSGPIAGTVVPDYVWYSDNSNDESTRTAYGYTGTHNHKVGEKKPTSLSLYDMNGNLWEWCADFYPGVTTYSVTHYDGINGNDGKNGDGDLFLNPINNSVSGPYSPPNRIARGGGWVSGAYRFRAGCRGYDYADLRASHIGFRPVFLFPFAP
ncbi:MAG: formylglycine-generating enzyme family protein, partial [Bacteroidales bacterium]|nr:formylglycine-generating enzyme family protein [Bacteroidales bacterium]